MQVNSACAPEPLTPKTSSPTSNSVTAAPDCLDHSGELAAEDPPLRPQETGEEAADEVLGAAEPTVRPVDGRGVDPDEDLVVLGHRPLDLLEPQDLGRAVPVVDDRSHALTSQVRGKRWIGLPWFQASPAR